MFAMNRLLAATDLSPPARHAADRAAVIAQQLGATLDLLHVASLGPMEKLRQLVAQVPPELEQRVLDAAREEMEALAASLLERHGIAAGVHVAAGPVLAELAGQAERLNGDLIVMGARGKSFMRHVMLGSTASRMVSKTRRPALVVKQAPHEPYRKLLVPVDFSPSSLPALKRARAIAPDAQIVLLHAFEVPFEGQLQFAGVAEDTIHRYRMAARQNALLQMRELCAAAHLPEGSAHLTVLRGDPSLHIIEQEQEQDCDLIVIGKHGEDVLEELLLGSVTKHVLAESQCDVLVSV